VLVYNGAYAFELGFDEEYPQIQGVIWAGGPGNVGFTALGEILAGTVNPSGRTNDTFVYDMRETPYWNNAEKRDYANMLHMTVEGMNAGVRPAGPDHGDGWMVLPDHLLQDRLQFALDRHVVSGLVFPAVETASVV